MAPPDQDAVQKLINKAIDDLDPELRKINRLVNIPYIYIYIFFPTM